MTDFDFNVLNTVAGVYSTVYHYTQLSLDFLYTDYFFISLLFICYWLTHSKVNVEVLATDNSLHFFNEDTIPVKVYRDQDEWKVGHEEVGFFLSFFFFIKP